MQNWQHFCHVHLLNQPNILEGQNLSCFQTKKLILNFISFDCEKNHFVVLDYEF